MPRLAAALILALTLAGCGGGSDESTSAATTSPAPTQPTAAGSCRDVEQPEAREPGTRTAPSKALDPAKTYRVTFRTSCGDFVVELDQKAAPHATASIVALAEADYFDGTSFHRIVPGFVIQGGDPTATGGGGPGYTTVDTPSADTAYTKGTVAMAKTGAEAPGTAGSQFFIVTGDDAGLPPDYAVIGHVVEGLEVVEAIGELGDVTESPTQPVVIDDVTVSST